MVCVCVCVRSGWVCCVMCCSCVIFAVVLWCSSCENTIREETQKEPTQKNRWIDAFYLTDKHSTPMRVFVHTQKVSEKKCWKKSKSFPYTAKFICNQCGIAINIIISSRAASLQLCSSSATKILHTPSHCTGAMGQRIQRFRPFFSLFHAQIFARAQSALKRLPIKLLHNIAATRWPVLRFSRKRQVLAYWLLCHVNR